MVNGIKIIFYCFQVYQTKLYARVDEILIALAYCSRQTYNIELRTYAYTEAMKIIDNQNDFLSFVRYCVRISEILHGDGKLGFGHGLCRVVFNWYEKHNTIELANMFGEHRGMHRWNHQSIIKNAHIRTKKRALNETATTESNSNPTTSSDASQSTNIPQTSSDDTSNTEQIQSNEDDRENVFQFVFCNSSIKYLNYLDQKTQLGAGAKRLKDLQMLKTNENTRTAVEAIRQHKFTLSQMPSHLLEKIDVWEILMPTLSYNEMLNHFHTVRDFGFFNPDSKLVQVFITTFSDKNKMKAEQICPIRLFVTKRLYEKKVRYLGNTKAEYYSKKVEKRQLTYNEQIGNHLEFMFNQALLDAAPAPAKYFITIDLRTGNQRSKFTRFKVFFLTKSN